MAQGFFGGSVINKVNEAEVPFWKCNQGILKRFFSLLEFSIYEKRTWFFVVLWADTFDHASPQFYPGVYVALVTLLTYPVSTCAAERSFSGMKRLKNALRSSTMSKERLSS